MSDLPAITLHQPWASAIGYLLKPYETRGWPPFQKLIGQRIAIHAGKRQIDDFSGTVLHSVLARNFGADYRQTIG